MTPPLAILALSACVPVSPVVAPPDPPSWSASPPISTSDTAPSTADTATTPEEPPFVCPDVAGSKAASFDYHTVNPCLLDPTVGLCVPLLDTHERGLRLHQIVRRDEGDGAPYRDELLLYVPPGPGDDNLSLLAFAAYAGFTVVSVGWNNADVLAQLGDTDAVFTEALHGVDATDLVDVPPNDSLDGRLDALFPYLIEHWPAVGWEKWWDPKTGLHWDQVVLLGWSDGATAVAHLARDREVDGAILVSGPGPDPFVHDPRATPPQRHQALFHALDRIAPGDPLGEVFAPMGMSGPIVDVDTTAPPYDGAQLYTTSLTDFQAPDCNFHGAVAVDYCMHDDLITPYLHMLCRAADVD